MVDRPSSILAFNAGSSSLKVEVFAHEPWRSKLRAVVEDIGGPTSSLRVDGAIRSDPVEAATYGAAAEIVLNRLLAGGLGLGHDGRGVLAMGHRVVHGGAAFSAPVVVTARVLDELEAAAQLAPLHNPPALTVMRVVRARVAGAPTIAVFDTSFFRDLPEHVRAYAVPRAWRDELGVRRYGFHGIAHEYLFRRFEALHEGLGARSRVVTLQLGQGCSAAALLDGRPVETSMGFTPLEGLIMGTRAGDLDPGVILHLARQGYSWQALDATLNEKSGLLGLSGRSADVRDLLALEAVGERGPTVAVAAFCHRLHKYVGAYAAVLGGIDALVFGGGIGENAPVIRSRVCAALRWLGLELDEEQNTGCIGVERRISRPTSSVAVYVVPVREEEAIARGALDQVLAGAVLPRRTV